VPNDATHQHSHAQVVFAWAVHLFTASGAVAGFLAVLAVFDHRWVPCFAWLMVAAAIDSCDGFLARVARVREVLPNFDGALLDNLVDYFTYVLVPAFLIYEAGLLPQTFALAGVSLIVLVSAYQFSQSDAKTEDHYFKGFPSYWNVVAFYLFFLGLDPWVNLAVVGALGVSVFVPVKYLYPSRAPHFRRLTIGLALVWAILLVVLLASYPNVNRSLVWLSLVFVAYYYGLSLFMTVAGRGDSPTRD
jgi:phosphatidylcholine synthase